MSIIIYETIRAESDASTDVIAEVREKVPDAKSIIIDHMAPRSIYEVRDGAGQVCNITVESYEYRVKAVI